MTGEIFLQQEKWTNIYVSYKMLQFFAAFVLRVILCLRLLPFSVWLQFAANVDGSLSLSLSWQYLERLLDCNRFVIGPSKAKSAGSGRIRRFSSCTLLSNMRNPRMYGDFLFHLNVVNISRSMYIPEHWRGLWWKKQVVVCGKSKSKAL